MTDRKWYADCFRRNLVDMHIEDWDERFLSEFDARTYVSLLSKANVRGAMIYANSHVGLCYWPTREGEQHKGLKGRDLLAELTRELRRQKMDIILYFSLIYDNRAYDRDASWRIVRSDGSTSREGNEKGENFSGSRYGHCCPNAEGYREHTRLKLEELCAGYDFDGFFFDMTFWPAVCYCPSCRKRFKEETAYDEMPRVIDWRDPAWLAFQERREAWMSEFAQFATGIVRKAKPGVTIDHQFSSSLHSWHLGVTEAIGDASDYCGGDFYGGYIQHSFVCKFFNSVSPNMPFEFHTSRCIRLHDHTSMKSRQELELANWVALAHNGAFCFIDAIDPVGTLNSWVYELMGDVFTKSERYEEYLGGRQFRDVALYFNLRSKMNFDDNGSRNLRLNWSASPHLESSLGAARTLQENHVLFTVIGRKNLRELNDTKVLVLSNVMFLSEEECRLIREFVYDGGTLYASGYSALTPLTDILGIETEGTVGEGISYIAPVADEEKLLPGVNSKYPLTVTGKQVRARAVEKESVRATVTLPYTDPSDTTHFASIHSNPPGRETELPAVVYRSHGKGRVLWISAPIEGSENDMHKKVFDAMIHELLGGLAQVKTTCPGFVEVIMHHQPANSRYIVNLINTLAWSPTVRDLDLSIDTGEKTVTGVTVVPDGPDLPFEAKHGRTDVILPELRTFSMLAVNYE